MPPAVSLADRIRSVLTVAPARVDHIPSFRIALGVAIPLAVLIATDNVPLTLYASFGAFTGIYSRYESTRTRFTRQSMVGAMMVACVTGGALTAHITETMPALPASILSMVLASLVAGAGATFVTAKGLKPAGAIFPLFGFAAVASAPPAAPVWVAFVVSAFAAGISVVLGLLGHYMGESRPPTGVDPATPQVSRGELAREFGLYSLVALLAGAAGLASGLPYPYWAQIAAVVPLPAPGSTGKLDRGLHRLVGTAIGVGVTAFLLSYPQQPWQLAVWVVVLQFVGEMFVLRNYAIAQVFITPLALLMVQLANPAPVVPMLQARVLETAIGVVVGLVVVLALMGVQRRREALALRRARKLAQQRRAAQQKTIQR